MSELESEPPAEPSPDEWYAARLRETRAIAAMRKRQIGLAARASIDPDEEADEKVTASELIAIDALESRIASRQRIQAIRERTRREARH